MTGLLVALVAAGAPVHFDAAPTCRVLDVGEVRRVLAVELRPSSPDADGRFVTSIHADCDGTQVRLVIADPVSRKSLERTVELASVDADSRSRVLGLAAAELVAMSWLELVTNPEPAAEPALPTPPAATREEAAALARGRAGMGTRSWLSAEGSLALTVGAPPLYGVGLRWSWQRFAIFGFELGARVEHGRAAFGLGDVDVNRASLAVGAHARLPLRFVTLQASALLRGGAVQLVGRAAPNTATRAGAGVGPWLGLAVGGAAAVGFESVRVELGIEAGAPLLGVVGVVAGHDAVRLDGVWFGAHIALGLSP